MQTFLFVIHYSKTTKKKFFKLLEKFYISPHSYSFVHKKWEVISVKLHEILLKAVLRIVFWDTIPWKNLYLSAFF